MTQGFVSVCFQTEPRATGLLAVTWTDSHAPATTSKTPARRSRCYPGQ
jgi:hypothetical protein